MCSALSLSRVWIFVTPWSVAHEAPLSVGILQARILEWVAIPFSRGCFQPRDWTQVSRIAGGFFTVWGIREALTLTVLCNKCYGVCVLSHVWLFVTSWTIAHSVPLPLGFPRQEYWSRLPSLPAGDLSNSGTETVFLLSPALALDSLPLSHLGKPHNRCYLNILEMQCSWCLLDINFPLHMPFELMCFLKLFLRYNWYVILY